MAWMNQLYQTYEDNIDEGHRNENSIVPIAHRNTKVQLQVEINSDGEFKGARVLNIEEAETLIPVTEKSVSRSGTTIAPNPLTDELSYIAGDFAKHCEDDRKKTTAEKKFVSYIRNLKLWADSTFTHPKVKAIYTYLQKKELISDLVKSGIIELEQSGIFSNKKINGYSYEKTLVRFCVLGVKDDKYSNTWEDDALIQMYINYYLSSLDGKEDICYFTGEKAVISETHPKSIVPSKANAKIISANDKTGFTYRGRFENAEQAFDLSYEASQKIHSALTWLIKRQGVYVGSQDKRTFVCWNPTGKAIPDILDAFGLVNNEPVEDSGAGYRQKLNKMLSGYRVQFEEGDQVIVMGLDAATTGRLSITYYNEFDALGFLDRIEYWGETCNWFFLKLSAERKPYYEIETPSFRMIVGCAFGRQRETFIDVDDKILKEQVQRLLKCMLEKQPIPTDIVQALTERASIPMAYSGWNRETVLSTACAVIAKKQYDLYEKEEEKRMKLDLENRDRSYLFGRLLAVLEKVEKVTYDRGEGRETNAIRLQSAYVNHPMQTWELLDDALRPYFQKLTPGTREYYKGMISDIIGLISETDAASLNQRLKDTYLLGYYLQRAELNKKKEEKVNG